MISVAPFVPKNGAGGGFAQRVRWQLLAKQGLRDVSLRSCAKSLAVSPRTLQRRLHAEGTSHRQLLDEVRCRLATEALAQPYAHVADLAFRLGFSEPAAFYRAFRRWTGVPPSVYRTARRRPCAVVGHDRALRVINNVAM